MVRKVGESHREFKERMIDSSQNPPWCKMV